MNTNKNHLQNTIFSNFFIISIPKICNFFGDENAVKSCQCENTAYWCKDYFLPEKETDKEKLETEEEETSNLTQRILIGVLFLGCIAVYRIKEELMAKRVNG